MVATKAVAVITPTPGLVVKRWLTSWERCHLLPFTLQGPDGLLHGLKLGNEDTQGFAGKRGELDIIGVFSHLNQVSNPRGTLASSAPQLTAMLSYGIDEYRALFDQKFP